MYATQVAYKQNSLRKSEIYTTIEKTKRRGLIMKCTDCGTIYSETNYKKCPKCGSVNKQKYEYVKTKKDKTHKDDNEVSAFVENGEFSPNEFRAG